MNTITRTQAFVQALNQPLGKRSVFIVESHEISLYQEALLKQSKHHSYIGIRVYTLDMYIKDLLLKNHLTLNKPTKLQRYLSILSCIDTKALDLFKNRDHFSTMVKIEEACVFLNDYALDLNQIDTSSLTLFSKSKFKDLYTLYSSLEWDSSLELLQQISLNNDDVYVTLTHLTRKQKNLFDEIEKHVSSLSYLNEDKKETTIQKHLHHYLWKEEKAEILDNHPYYFYQASNKEDEVKMVCSDIYDLVKQGVSYDQIAIYLHGGHYQELFSYYATKVNLPIEYQHTTRSFVKTFFDQIIEYFIEDDMKACIECLNVMEQEPIYTQVRNYEETKDLAYLETIPAFVLLEQQKKRFNEAHTFKDKCEVLKSFLVYVDEKESGALKHFLESHQEVEVTCFNDLFKQWYHHFYQEQEVASSYKHHIRLLTHEESILDLIGVDYVYYLGVNETVVPATFKDQDLLLEDEKKVLKQYEPLIPLISDKIKQEQDQILNVFKQPMKRFVFSYSMKEVDGSINLPSSLYLKMESLFTKKVLTYTMHPLFIEEHILSKTYCPDLVKEYHENRFRSTSIKDEIDLYPIDHFKVSASQIECYNQCPFKYYLRYGLRLPSKQSELLQANEIGNMMHHTFEVLSDVIFTPWTTMENVSTYKESMKDLSVDEMLEMMIDECLETYIEKHGLKRKIETKQRNLHLYLRLKKDLVLLLKVLHAQQSLSKFDLIEQEGSVYGKSEAGHVLYGRYDRLDAYKDYLKIVDYKSSQKEIDLDLAMQGFNIQMLLYLDLASQKHHKKGGIVAYFNGKPRVFKVDEGLTFTDFLKEYSLSGYMVKDTDLIQALDCEVYERPSPVYKLRYTKSKDDFTGHLLTEKQWDQFMQRIYHHIDDLLKSLLEGNIDIAPKGSKESATMAKVNPCTYCEYHPICQKDLFYHDYVEVKKRSANEIKILLGGNENESV